MTDLKPYFDRAKADSDEVTRLQNEANTLFHNGTDEGIQAAIDLQPALEAATLKAESSNKLYLTMRNADQNTSNAASLFVAAPGAEEEQTDETKTVNRAAFFGMTAKAREDFLKSGGVVKE